MSRPTKKVTRNNHDGLGHLKIKLNYLRKICLFPGMSK